MIFIFYPSTICYERLTITINFFPPSSFRFLLTAIANNFCLVSRLIAILIEFNGRWKFEIFKFYITVIYGWADDEMLFPIVKYSLHISPCVLSKSADLFDILPRSIMSSAMCIHKSKKESPVKGKLSKWVHQIRISLPLSALQQ